MDDRVKGLCGVGLTLALVVLVTSTLQSLVVAFCSTHNLLTTLCVQTMNPETDIDGDLIVAILDLPLMLLSTRPKGPTDGVPQPT